METKRVRHTITGLKGTSAGPVANGVVNVLWDRTSSSMGPSGPSPAAVANLEPVTH